MERKEYITRWLWHAFHGLDQNTGMVDPTELKVLTAHVGASLGANNTGKMASKVAEKYKCDNALAVCFSNYLEFLNEQQFLQNDSVDTDKLEHTCWLLSIKEYEKRGHKIIANPELKKLWQIFNFLAEPDIFPISIDREEMAILMEKLVVAIGMKWDMSHFEYVTKDLKTFTFTKMLCCYETAFVKGMDKQSIAEAVMEAYDEIIEEVEKKGVLYKKGHKMKSWRERWFVLKPGCLSYYTNRNEKDKKGDIIITSCWEAETIPDLKSYKNLFALWTKDCKNDKTRYEMSAQDPRTRQAWLIALNAIIQREQTKGLGQYGELLKRREKRKKEHERLEEEQRHREVELMEKKRQEKEIEDLQKAQEAAERKATEELALRRAKEVEERSLRQQEMEEKQQAEKEMEMLKAAQVEAEQRAEVEAKLRKAKEEEEEKRRFLEQQARELQAKELESVKAARLEAECRAEEEARLRRAKEEEEEERRRIEYEEREKQAMELEVVKAARLDAERRVEEEARLRKAKEEEEEKRRLIEEEERALQARELEELKSAYADASKRAEIEAALKEAEQKRHAELEELLRHLESLLEDERRAKREEEIAKALQQRLLEEETQKREHLEKLKEEQARILKVEQQRREDLEIKSEELSKQREEQEAILEKERDRLVELEQQRQAADQQLQVAMEKISKAEKAKESKERLRRELMKPVGLARLIQPTAKPLVTHRGYPAFFESLTGKLRKEQKELMQELETEARSSANGHLNGCNGQLIDKEAAAGSNR